MATTYYSNTASEPQVRFIKSLWDDLNKTIVDADSPDFTGTPTQADSLRRIEASALARLDKPVTKRFDNGAEIALSAYAIVELALADHEISKPEASAGIEALKTLLSEVRAEIAKVGLPKPPSPYAGVPVNAERVIDARFASKCSVCGVRDQYIAYCLRGSWYPMCETCAHADPADKDKDSKIEVLIQQVLERLGKGNAERGNIGLAVSNPDEMDGFTYYRMSRSGVAQVKGGTHYNATSDLRPALGVKVLEEIVKGDVVEMAKQFGRHFTRCGVCGLTLKDETSKALGIGPDCAKHL